MDIWSDGTIAEQTEQTNNRTNERQTRKVRATQPSDHGRLRWAIELLSEIFLNVTGCEAYWPVDTVEHEVEGGEEKEHPLVDDPSALLGVIFFFRLVVFFHMEPDERTTSCKHWFFEPYESQLDPIDENCPENEKEVNENPKRQGCKSLWHLNRFVKTALSMSAF